MSEPGYYDGAGEANTPRYSNRESCGSSCCADGAQNAQAPITTADGTYTETQDIGVHFRQTRDGVGVTKLQNVPDGAYFIAGSGSLGIKVRDGYVFWLSGQLAGKFTDFNDPALGFFGILAAEVVAVQEVAVPTNVNIYVRF